MSVKIADGTVTYQSQFKAIYDGNGKNLAPNGAAQLTFDPVTGRLVAWR